MTSLSRSLLLALAALPTLAGCGGMDRAVGVLPNTFDDLKAKTAPLRGEPARATPPDPRTEP